MPREVVKIVKTDITETDELLLIGLSSQYIIMYKVDLNEWEDRENKTGQKFVVKEIMKGKRKKHGTMEASGKITGFHARGAKNEEEQFSNNKLMVFVIIDSKLYKWVEEEGQANNSLDYEKDLEND